MKHEIELLTKDVKEGIYTKQDAQKKICKECMLHPSWECKRPCYPKKITQLQQLKSHQNKNELPQQKQCKGVKLVIEPNNLEQIQKAQLDKILMVTIRPNHLTERGYWENRRTSRYSPITNKRQYFYNVKGDGHLWIQHMSYKIGSEQSKRMVNR